MRPFRSWIPGLVAAVLVVTAANPNPECEYADVSAHYASPAFGKSGKLRAQSVLAGTRAEIPLLWQPCEPTHIRYRWEPVNGTSGAAAEGILERGVALAPARPGVYQLRLFHANGGAIPTDRLDWIVLAHATDVRHGKLNGYRIGRYPDRTGSYAPPQGFIEVTLENRNVKLSEHLRLRDFLTKNQANVWPKYVVISPLLVDKLELTMNELNRMGIPAHRLHVMSGYRTPEYNGPGGDGRAKLSRHIYGDAADVWIDNDGDNYIDDLNRDGRKDATDAMLIRIAVDAVEKQHPTLVGGVGVYTNTRSHGPFTHIDTRGTHARW